MSNPPVLQILVEIAHRRDGLFLRAFQVIDLGFQLLGCVDEEKDDGGGVHHDDLGDLAPGVQPVRRPDDRIGSGALQFLADDAYHVPVVVGMAQESVPFVSDGMNLLENIEAISERPNVPLEADV